MPLMQDPSPFVKLRLTGSFRNASILSPSKDEPVAIRLAQGAMDAVVAFRQVLRQASLDQLGTRSTGSGCKGYDSCKTCRPSSSSE